MCTTQTSPNLQESGICDEFKLAMRKAERDRSCPRLDCINELGDISIKEPAYLYLLILYMPESSFDLR